VDGGDPIQVEIWSDLICPWCYLGKRRFEHALARFPGRDQVDVRWRSFQLEPRSPVEPVDLAAGLVTRFGMTADEAVERNRHMTELAAADGLAYRLDIARLGNTFDAHHITHLAEAEGLQDEAVERLFAAYFCEGRAISDRATLIEIAGGLGLDRDDVAAALASDLLAPEVRADEREASELGIHAVPFFVVDRRYAIAGAQPQELFLQGLERALADRQNALT
jgi:predicted DsbA family dithiol-disulfide isomerase